MLDPNGARQFLVNWEEVCTDLLHWIQREAMSDGPGGEATNLLAELLAFPGINAAAQTLNLDRPEHVHDDHDAGNPARCDGSRTAN
jgi:hypothetical protein